MTKCEFCEELSATKETTFSNIYGGVLRARVVKETDSFVVMPTIGQLTIGSLLIIPKRHVATCALFERREQKEFEQVLDEVLDWASQYGPPVFFEHGAQENTGGSCGIYHAHLHVVPLHKKIELDQFFPEHTVSFASLNLALESYRFTDQYLLIGDRQKVLSTKVGDFDPRFPSQFFRRRLVENLGLSRNWNWREYKGVEEDLVETVQRFEAQRASSG